MVKKYVVIPTQDSLDLVPKCKESSLFGNCLSSRTPDSFEIMLTPYCFPLIHSDYIPMQTAHDQSRLSECCKVLLDSVLVILEMLRLTIFLCISLWSVLRLGIVLTLDPEYFPDQVNLVHTFTQKNYWYSKFQTLIGKLAN